MDIIDIAKKEIRIFERPSANTSKELLEDLKRAREALTIVGRYLNGRDIPEEIDTALDTYWNNVKHYSRKGE